MVCSLFSGCGVSLSLFPLSFSPAPPQLPLSATLPAPMEAPLQPQPSAPLAPRGFELSNPSAGGLPVQSFFRAEPCILGPATAPVAQSPSKDIADSPSRFVSKLPPITISAFGSSSQIQNVATPPPDDPVTQKQEAQSPPSAVGQEVPPPGEEEEEECLVDSQPISFQENPFLVANRKGKGRPPAERVLSGPPVGYGKHGQLQTSLYSKASCPQQHACFQTAWFHIAPLCPITASMCYTLAPAACRIENFPRYLLTLY